MELEVKKYVKTVPTEMVLLTQRNAHEVAKWAANRICPVWLVRDGRITEYLEIITAEGKVKAHFGDYVAKDTAGNPYPINPDIVAASYKEVE